MLKNYFKIAWRNLQRSRISSFINISGLAVGMAVAMLTGLWLHDELSFNQYHENYDRVVRVAIKGVSPNQRAEGSLQRSFPIPGPIH